MAQELESECINHPRRTTRVRCSSCNSPICSKCMRESSVGMKCPSCATPPRRARMLGKPRHYVLGSLAGLSTAMVAGALLIGFRIGYFGLLGAVLIGYVVGSVVVRTSANQKHAGIRTIAGVSTVLGLTAGALWAGLPVEGLLGGRFLIPFLIAGAAAAFFAGR